MSVQQPVPSFYADILFRARLNPYGIAVSVGSTNVTYGTFREHIDRVTRRVQALELPATTRVAVHIRDEYLKWLVNIGLARLGLVSFSLSNPVGELRLVQSDTVITDNEATPDSVRRILARPDWATQPADDLPAVQDRMHAPDATCRIVLSSGTTGRPKMVAITYGVLRARVQQTTSAHMHAGTRLLVAMGTATIGGFATPISCWRVGGTVLLPKVNAIASIAAWLLQLAPTTLLLSPGQLGLLVDSLPKDFWPTRELSVIVGGSTLPRQLAVRARLRLTQSLLVVYGSTEAGSVALAYAAATEGRPGFAGFVLPTVDVQIVDAEDRPLPAGKVGEVRIRSQGGIAGYLEDSEPVQDAFRDGWFYPGDSGQLTSDGALIVVGRTRELLNFAGAKIAPADIEEVLTGVPGVIELAVYGGTSPSGTTFPCVAAIGSEALEDEALVRACAKAFPWMPPPTITRVAAIPRNEMGKVMRTQLPVLKSAVVA
jgi:acyl-coenzyme A synthetase/AMP-(fatty) acid ligase